MKEEIKEILEKLKENISIVSVEEEHLLLDYITNLQEENEELKNGYCELKVKCNNGECDCTNEEYDGMIQTNMKLSLEIEKLNNIIDGTKEYIKYQLENMDFEKDTKAKMLGAMVLVMLDKELKGE